MDYLFPYPKMGVSFLEILEDPLTRKLLGHDATHAEKVPFISGVMSRLTFLLSDPTKHLSFLKIGYTALEAFLQANVTGPPLEFDSIPVIFPEAYRDENLAMVKQEMLGALSVDGDAAYSLLPRLELFWLAKVVMSNSTLAAAGFNGRRARFRVNFWHQKLLAEKSDSLKEQLYADAEILEGQLGSRYQTKSAAAEEHFVEFLTERAAIQIFYGDDAKAREDLTRAAGIRNFQFALTGALGKRTKYQQRDISQLLVLAKSRDTEPETYSSRKSSRVGTGSRKSSLAEAGAKSPAIRSKSPAGLNIRRASQVSVISNAISESDRPGSPLLKIPHPLSPKTTTTQPENIPLNDDTVLERIAFSKPQLTTISDETSIQPDLAEIDPSNQPQLFPMDSVILLSTASSISNEKPEDGLTREETLPYALRVLEGGSSNWSVYTQALLVRSRIEGYKSRTVERGLLQLQALVDQVIAETSGSTPVTSKGEEADTESHAPSTFLPKLSATESASVAERLKYIYQLSPPLRWELEAELAQRWTQMGGLKSALEIYERLQMKAEVALCLAATDREAEAAKLIKGMVFDDADADASGVLKLRQPLPNDAPRLLCILGDVEQQPKYYVLGWEVSKKRYARAQRSLGRYYSSKKNFERAAEAYAAAVHITRLDTSTWFALGCMQIQLEDWPSAVESFTRVVQLEDKDAEGWSNLALALLRLPPPTTAEIEKSKPTPGTEGEQIVDGEEDEPSQRTPNPMQHTHEALRALRRAAQLKRDDARIWDNYLTVAASIPPSQGTPWNEIVQAMGRVIELRSKKEGESCIDLKVLNMLVKYVTAGYDYPAGGEEEEEDEHQNNKPTSSPAPQVQPESTQSSNEPSKTKLPFFPRAVLKLVDTQITPLAGTPTLFSLLATLSLWRHRPSDSLSYTEKAWRATIANPAIYETKSGWKDVVKRTVQLANAYRDLGEKQKERTGGVVEKGWRFKARTAVRGVMGRGKELWEGTEGWTELEEVVVGLKG